ncbi:MAG: adenosylcobinamide-GDP ribazoletransferase [Rhodospirillaceae bacterium]|mgnify:CR=1 FL=1|jgi:adenosylcobinamide-GDP ribazoletransferase|nr:adenosylcobinamide-GDP ribazoletransferase [Rhodospirillaceae bacterium]
MTSSDDKKETISPLKDVYASVLFLTRVPAPSWPNAANRPLANSMWAFPVAGAAAAVIAGAAYAIADALGLPLIVAGLLAVAALIFVTGALHEDGLADTADGIGGGHDEEARLEIMSDSRIGAYGAIALVVSVAGRAALLASIAQPLFVLGALVAAAAVSRAALPMMMALDTPAKSSGLGADAGKPDGPIWGLAVLLGAVAAAMAAPSGWFICVIAALLAALVTGWFCRARVGGYTGDTLGATQQVAEFAALAAIAAAMSRVD